MATEESKKKKQNTAKSPKKENPTKKSKIKGIEITDEVKPAVKEPAAPSENLGIAEGKPEQVSKKAAKATAVKKKEEKVKPEATKGASTKATKQAALKENVPTKKRSVKAVRGSDATGEKTFVVHFILKFHTKFGEQLFITGNHPLLGGGNVSDAFPLTYLNDEHWHGYLSFKASDLPATPIVYNYVLKNIDGTFSIDAGTDKQIDKSMFANSKLFIADSWNHPGYFENVFYTEPFKKVLLNSSSVSPAVADTGKATHLFRCKAPLLSQDEVLCIVGANPPLKLWNQDEPLLMTKAADKDYYEVGVDFSGSSFPVLYKYGVYNTAQQKFIHYERSNNRILYQQPEADAFAIINDGFAVLPNTHWKGAGVAIPVFSLRSENGLGVGEFNDLPLLVDWAKNIGLKLVQILPVNDTIATHSWLDSYPYSAISAFALNPIYLNLDALLSDGAQEDIKKEIADAKQRLNEEKDIDFDTVVKLKWDLLKRIYPTQKNTIFKTDTYKQFFEKNDHWLVPYAVFCYLRDKFSTADFKTWPEEYCVYSAALAKKLLGNKQAKDDISLHYYVQYALHTQLCRATEYAHRNGIILKGDIPIGIYRNSCDAWQHPELYHMDMQAGAPPDDFAVKGQNWGFPTYNWQKMREDGFSWWRQRFEQMSNYFDAFRIDHILGFFRIWSIPMHAVEGIMGHFVPAIPIHVNEFNQRHLYFDQQRYCMPFINDDVLWSTFNDVQDSVKEKFLTSSGYGMYSLKPEFATQKLVQDYFDKQEDNQHNQWIKQGLFDLISNVILFEEEGSHGQGYHFRFGMQDTASYHNLDANTKHQLYQLYVNYFFERQDNFWREEAMHKLPELKRATNMLICGEDLGMVPASVPGVMKELGILSLEIQRMPKDPKKTFFHPADAPYLSVVTPSTHDMSTIRGWWEENKQRTQTFYNSELGQAGTAPDTCEPWINKAIVFQHLYSPAMWSIFQLQDLMGIDESIRRENAEEERINVPSNPRHYWRYRMHLTLEQLLNEQQFNTELMASIKASGR